MNKYKIDDAVEFTIDGKNLVGYITSINLNPVTNITYYIVTRKNEDTYSFLEHEIHEYEHAHILPTFTKINYDN
jgi:hypothetical protein